MTDTEWAVLRDVVTARLATATQLQRLQALRADVSVRTFRRVLQRLYDGDVLFRLDRVVGGRQAGSAGFVYGVGIAGQRLLSQEPRRPWTPRPSWLAHALGTSELYVQLREAEALDRLRLNTFEAEPESWRRYVAPGGGIVDIKPDAFIELETEEFVDRYFIEVDMGTESPRTIRSKASAYRDYWLSGTEQADDGLFPLVLWLVPDERRLLAVEEAIAALGEASTLHRVALASSVIESVLDDPP